MKNTLSVNNKETVNNIFQDFLTEETAQKFLSKIKHNILNNTEFAIFTGVHTQGKGIIELGKEFELSLDRVQMIQFKAERRVRQFLNNLLSEGSELEFDILELQCKSVRLKIALQKLGVKSIEETTVYSIKELREKEFFGEKSETELLKLLQERNLSLKSS